MIARKLDPKDYVKAHQACMDFYAGPEFQCSPARPFPPLSEFTDPSHSVYVAYEGATIVAVCIMRSNHARWYNARPDKFVEAAALLKDTIIKDMGPLTGHVENPKARELFVKATGAEGDGPNLRFY